MGRQVTRDLLAVLVALLSVSVWAILFGRAVRAHLGRRLRFDVYHRPGATLTDPVGCSTCGSELATDRPGGSAP